MGCELSKLNKKICKKSETAKTHVDFIKEHGMAKYNEVMEIEPRMPYENIDKSIDNHSSSFNVGLVNLKTVARQRRPMQAFMKMSPGDSFWKSLWVA